MLKILVLRPTDELKEDELKDYDGNSAIVSTVKRMPRHEASL